MNQKVHHLQSQLVIMSYIAAYKCLVLSKVDEHELLVLYKRTQVVSRTRIYMYLSSDADQFLITTSGAGWVA